MPKMKIWNGADWIILDANNGESVNGIFFRENNGKIQYSTDKTNWKNAGAIGTAKQADVLTGKTFSSDEGTELSGSMVNHGTVNIMPSAADQTKSAGYISSLKVQGDVNLKAQNIKKGIAVFGVNGTLDAYPKIAGTEKYVVIGENVAAGDAVYKPISLDTIYTSGSIQSPNNDHIQDFAVSSNGDYFAVGISGANLLVYKNNGSYETITIPNQLKNCRGLDFSVDNKYLAVSYFDSIPYIFLYKIDNGTFTKMANPTSYGSRYAYGVSISNDCKYICVADQYGSYITFYRNDDGILTKLPLPAVTPNSRVYSVKFSDNGNYLACGCLSSKQVAYVYKREGDSFVNIPVVMDDRLGGDENTSVAFTRNAEYLIVSSNLTLQILKRDGDAFYKVSNILPIKGGIYPKVVCNTIKNLVIADGLVYKVIEGKNSFGKTDITIQNAPSAPYEYNKQPLAMSADGNYILSGGGTGYNSTIYVSKFNFTDTYYKADGALYRSNASLGFGYALESGTAGQTIKIIETIDSE